MIVLCILQIILSILLARNDVKGLIYASSIVMLLRVLANIRIILSDYKNKSKDRQSLNLLQSLNEISPRIYTLILTLLCNVIINFGLVSIFSEKRFILLFSSGLIFLCNLVGIYVLEKREIKQFLTKTKTE
jgi:hypothetical protein